MRNGVMSRHCGSAAACGLLAAAALSACGDRPPTEPAATPERPETSLIITFDRDGRGPLPPRSSRVRCIPPTARAICRRLSALPADALAPVPRDAICTEIYGGPQTGRIRGRVEGRRVDARFSRRNGCEIARFEAVAPLLRSAGQHGG